MGASVIPGTTSVIPALAGDPCIISFLPLQGEVPKAEGVLLRQALSGTCASRTPSVAPRQLPLRGGANQSKAFAERGNDGEESEYDDGASARTTAVGQSRLGQVGGPWV